MVCKYFLIIFSSSLWYFAEKQLVNFDKAQFIVLFLWIVVLVSRIRTLYLVLNTKDFCYFLHKYFIVLHFTCKFIIHFELFIQGMRYKLGSIFFPLVLQLFQHHLLKGCPCSTELLLLLCEKSVGHIV